ncbi:hypothetical protein D7B24_004434 [Verticillium nonalfalfae]|uniref:Mid2 domain-containing protein n=1 Tax=Verticillium nonalfalfae TaxID=1051616 RepID=A0A3M9YEJ1_9PEZI|nr:uncharacterized protein D7B24_004434 [Verticillium nonalfalfae]RNJ58565.1 hypothetical protein D7B24_004434 [Verticillium nonalfalfae]
MGKRLLYLASAVVLTFEVSADLYRVPEATTVFNFPLDQVNPRPTPAPYDFLKARQETSSSQTVLVAPSNTCGYVSGRPGAAFTCNGADANCLFFTADSTLRGAVACCNSDVCGARVTCYDRDAIASSSVCDNGCLVDTFTLKCTESSARYCNTISFSSNIWDYFCNSIEISTPQVATTTYQGQSNAEDWAPLVLTGSGESSVTLPPESARTPIFDDESSRSPAPSSTGGSTTDGGSGSSGGGSSTPVGAIVGGVVGGVAAIAIAGFLIWFCLRRKKKQEQANNQPIPPPVMQQAPGPQNSYPPNSPPPQHPSPNSHQSYYDPKFGGYVQNYQQTPSPGNDAYSPGFQQQQQQQALYGQQQTSPGGYYPAGAAVPDRQDTTSPSSLSGSTAHRLSTVAPTSPGSVQGGGAYQQGAPVYGHQGQTQPTIHEAPNGGDHHRGQMHEMA